MKVGEAKTKALLNNAKIRLAQWGDNPKKPSEKKLVNVYKKLVKRYTKRLNYI